jgi:hypothetical protein
MAQAVMRAVTPCHAMPCQESDGIEEVEKKSSSAIVHEREGVAIKTSGLTSHYLLIE